MSITNTGGAAFPHQELIDYSTSMGVSASTGMTLRDYFAAQALPAVIQTAIERGARAFGGGPITEEVIAMQAYVLADAMLAERAK